MGSSHCHYHRTRMKAFVISALLGLASTATVSHVSHVGHGIGHGHSISHGHHAVVHAASAAYHAPAPVVYHAPAPVYHAAPAYHAPAPAYHAPVKYAKESPEPYSFTYGVSDDYSKANFNAAESGDANGVVGGSYTVSLPDSRIQTVTYTADHANGFVADVSYSGEAVYPPAPAGGYPGEAKAYSAPAYAAPVYHAPAPAYHA